MPGVIPILDINGQVIENKSDKMIYLLKWLVFNPGWTSSWYDDKLMSMRRSTAEYAHDPERLVPALQRYISTAIKSFYSDYDCVINRIDDPNDPTVYSLEIKITDSTGIPVISLDRIKLDESGAFVFEGKV